MFLYGAHKQNVFTRRMLLRAVRSQQQTTNKLLALFKRLLNAFFCLTPRRTSHFLFYFDAACTNSFSYLLTYINFSVGPIMTRDWCVTGITNRHHETCFSRSTSKDLHSYLEPLDMQSLSLLHFLNDAVHHLCSHHFHRHFFTLSTLTRVYSFHTWRTAHPFQELFRRIT